MALPNFTGYSAPRYPTGAITIAAISDLLGNVLGGVEDWKRRKMDEDRYAQEREYQNKMMALRRAAESRAGAAAGREAEEYEKLHEEPMLEGPTQTGDSLTGRSIWEQRQMAPIEAAAAGRDYQNKMLALKERGLDIDERAALAGDGFGGPDRALAQSLIMSLDEMMSEFAADMAAAGDDANLQAQAAGQGEAIARRIAQAKSMLPNSRTIEEIENRINATTSQEEATLILEAALNSGELEPLEQMYLRTVAPYATREKPATGEDYLAKMEATRASDMAASAPPTYGGGFGSEGYITHLLKALGIEPQFHWERFNIGR